MVRMKQVRLKLLLNIPILLFGIFGITYSVIKIFYVYDCGTRFDIGSYENVTYFLQRSNSKRTPGYNHLEGDYELLININFRFTTLNLVCENKIPLLLILIHSAPKNVALRKVIRETWGKSQEHVKILFLLGSTDDIRMENILQQENKVNKDLLQGNFSDAYKNLTYKHVMGLKYVVYHCSQVKYVLKVNDDVCVNLPTLKKFLASDLSLYGAENLLMCNAIRNARALRGTRTKWKVTLEEYKETFYPTFCLGWCILYSPDVVLRLYTEAQHTNYFWIDDVHVTGVLVAKMDSILHTDISPLTLSSRSVQSLCKYRPFLFGWANMNENEIRCLWRDIEDSPVPESVTGTLVTERSLQI